MEHSQLFVLLLFLSDTLLVAVELGFQSLDSFSLQPGWEKIFCDLGHKVTHFVV